MVRACNWTCLLWTLTVLALTVTVGGTKPHIVFILGDDIGWNDIGYHGSEVKTPNLDALAKSGVKLDNYYVQPLCSPTRGQLLTGRYQIHYGLQSNNLPTTCPCALPLEVPTLADKLRKQGYATHIVGKWHLGFYSQKYIPTSRGFDSHYGYYVAFEDHFTHMRDDYVEFHDNEQIIYGEEGYSTTLFKDRAIKLLEDHSMHNSQKPMFLYLPFQAAHAPLQAPDHFIERHTSIIRDERRRIFAGMMAALDDAVGDIVHTLKKTGMWENTILVFSSDNGGIPLYGGNNWPLRGEKVSLFEGGIRAVGFVAGPVLPRGGATSKDLMHVSDWFPTLLKLAGGDITSEHKLDGYDMWQTLSEGTPSPRTEILHTIDPLNDLWGSKLAGSPFDNRQLAAIRVGDWKLMTGEQILGIWTPVPDHPSLNHSYTSDSDDPEKNIRLFDLANDPTEMDDLSDSHPEVVMLMLDKLAEYEATMVEPIPQTFDNLGNPQFNGKDYWGPWVD